MVYKGGFIVPVLLGMFIMVLVFSIERFFVISKASGTGSLDAFMYSVQNDIKEGRDRAFAYNVVISMIGSSGSSS